MEFFLLSSERMRVERWLLLIFAVLLSHSAWADQDWSRWRLEDHMDPLAMSILGRYTTSQDLARMARMPTQGEIITIDTHNKEACEKTRAILDEKTDLPDETLKALCVPSEKRYVSIVRIEPALPVKSAFEFEFRKQPTIGDQVEVFNFLGVGVMGLIAALPPEISNWGEGTFDDPLAKWKSNVSNPPVIDQDDWMINYLGHPYSGAAYYVVARQTGFGQMASFGFAAMMSTFYWEYGFEAFAEKPSIQDLILTPTIGSLLGEQMYQLHRYIEQEQGALFGSRKMGTFGMIVSDPVGSLVKGINHLGNNQWVHSGKLSWASFPMYDEKGTMLDYGVGLRMTLKFGKRK